MFVPTDPFRAAEKELRRKLNKHALTNSSKTSKQEKRSSLDMMKISNLFIFFSVKNKHIEKKLTRTKHKCVPFLLARSSFRGLSKNMASEEDAFERQEKQSSLRAPDLPLL